MAGGRPGERGLNVAYLYNEDETGHVAVNLGGKAVLGLKPGEYIQINTPGGGGYGAEGGREAAEDLHRGYV